MTPNPKIMQAVEQLGYRVTVGDVAAQTGLDLKIAEQGLLALASDAGGHMQVAASGDIAYQFEKNFRAILRNKFLRLQLQQWWEKIWKVLFYLIRISFGIYLLVSICVMLAAIAIIVIALSATSDNDNGNGGGGDSSRGGGIVFFPTFDWFWIFYPDYGDRPTYRQRGQEKSELNFLEAVFSFLFGDGNPNANLESRRWQEIAGVIRHNRGAVVAEQIAPYLDDLGSGYAKEYEDYMIPVLTKFNGYPEVSPDGQIVYRFPELQVTAKASKLQSVSTYLKEFSWRFSKATSGQILLSSGLGMLNFVLALVLGNLLGSGAIAAQIGGFVAFVQSIYWILLGYGIAFLAVPLIRYFWIQWRNGKIERRNFEREQRVMLLAEPDANLQNKIAYARQFAGETAIAKEDLVYTTETDLIEQDIAQAEQIDAEWQRRLDQSSS
jgi:hypothetical protein